MGSGSASRIEDRTLCDGVSINITVTHLSVRSLSKIAHIYRLIVTGVVGNPAGASVFIKSLELRCPPSDRVPNGSLSAIGSSCQIAKFSSSQACIVLGAAGAGTGEIQLNCSLAVLEWRGKGKNRRGAHSKRQKGNKEKQKPKDGVMALPACG